MYEASTSSIVGLGVPSRLNDAMWTGLERRTVRSLGAGDAMTHALDWAVTRGGTEAALLADDDGFLVCSSHSDADLTALAAILPLLARGDATAKLRRDGSNRGLTLTTIGINGESIHVALLGGSAAARRAELRRICAAARRILGS